jgi:rare lipoprotein A (peptidoglycan hydrolase)
MGAAVGIAAGIVALGTGLSFAAQNAGGAAPVAGAQAAVAIACQPEVAGLPSTLRKISPNKAKMAGGASAGAAASKQAMPADAAQNDAPASADSCVPCDPNASAAAVDTAASAPADTSGAKMGHMATGGAAPAAVDPGASAGQAAGAAASAGQAAGAAASAGQAAGAAAQADPAAGALAPCEPCDPNASATAVDPGASAPAGMGQAKMNGNGKGGAKAQGAANAAGAANGKGGAKAQGAANAAGVADPAAQDAAAQDAAAGEDAAVLPPCNPCDPNISASDDQGVDAGAAMNDANAAGKGKAAKEKAAKEKAAKGKYAKDKAAKGKYAEKAQAGKEKAAKAKEAAKAKREAKQNGAKDKGAEQDAAEQGADVAAEVNEDGTVPCVQPSDNAAAQAQDAANGGQMAGGAANGGQMAGDAANGAQMAGDAANGAQMQGAAAMRACPAMMLSTVRTATTSGEVSDPNSMTAGSSTYPVGTLLRVTNPTTNKSVTVRVNNTGPGCVAMQSAAFRAIGAPGTNVIKNATVRVVGQVKR